MLVSPSILTADFTRLEAEVKKIATADFIHLDIMDGHFVPNISFGPHIASSVAKLSKIPMDVHLMVTHPNQWIDLFSFPNTRYITLHVEAKNVQKSIDKIKEKGLGVGLSIKPNTPVKRLKKYLNQADLILVMTVEPGFGGQKFMTKMLDKVRELKKLREKRGFAYLIEVDGGVSDENIALCHESGVDMVVAGSYVFNHENPEQAIQSLK